MVKLCHNSVMESLALANHFLIAMPSMSDPLFTKSLVYVCEHGEHGAMGLIINKPSGIAIAQLFNQIDLSLNPLSLQSDVVYFGGPIQPDRGFVLHRPVCSWQSSLLVTDDIALTTSKDILIAVSEGEHLDNVLITLGYAGWGSQQLESEIADNAWLTVLADPFILFDLPYEKRYDAALSLLGVDPSFLSMDAGHA